MNLLDLINPSLVTIYSSITLSNHSTITLKRFVLQFIRELCNLIFILSTFNTTCMCLNIQCDFFQKFLDLNKAEVCIRMLQKL